MHRHGDARHRPRYRFQFLQARVEFFYAFLTVTVAFINHMGSHNEHIRLYFALTERKFKKLQTISCYNELYLIR